MDWTGGTRRRFAAKKNNAVQQRQKAYFARARAALNAPHQQSAFPGIVERQRTQSTYRLPHLRPLSHSHSERSERYRSQQGGLERSQKATDEVHNRTRTYRQDSHTVTNVRSRGRSSANPARNDAAATDCESTQNLKIPSDDEMNEEERLLLANRRQLLARSDWLGLAPAQPLSMKFLSSHDRDRIGKRRKVENSRPRRDDSLGPRMLTPLFEELLRPVDYVMSGALPSGDYNIKIGTDALATQTQASNRSFTPANTSMRPPSTELERLSEESMLLDADDGDFDPPPVSDSVPLPMELLHQQTQYVCDVPNMRRLQDEDGTPTLLLEQGQQQHNTKFYGPKHEDDLRERNRDEPDANGGLARELYETFSHESIKSILSEPEDPVPVLPSPKNIDLRNLIIAPELDEDDEMWRSFMNVIKHVSSNPSTKAVKSSSLHLTSSESNNRPVLVREDPTATALAQSVLPLQSAKIRMPSNDEDMRAQGFDQQSQSRYLGTLQSPSTSLKLITDLANQPAQAVPAVHEEDQENALWREFVCGGDEDSDELSQILSIDRQSDKVAPEASTLVLGSSSLMVSDLGTSNKTTLGGDAFTVDESVIENETDDIVDEESVDEQTRPSKNMHTTRALNPKRFLPIPHHPRAPPRQSSRFLPPGRVQTQASRLGHSVYDLVDSDGNSLA